MAEPPYVSPFPNLIGRSFPNPHKIKEVSNGSNGKVWELLLSTNQTAFITHVAITCFPDCYLRFVIDGNPVEEDDIKRSIGSIDQPIRYDPPFVAENFIRVIGYNDRSADDYPTDRLSVIFEVLIQGVIYSV